MEIDNELMKTARDVVLKKHKVNTEIKTVEDAADLWNRASSIAETHKNEIAETYVNLYNFNISKQNKGA